MDAGTLRIILIVLGAFLLGALYLWERRRIESDAEPEDHSHERSLGARRRDPSFGARFTDAADDTDPTEPASEAELAGRVSGSGDVEVASVEVASNLRDAPASAEALGSNEAAQSQTSTSTVNHDSLLVQLFVVARDEHFDGSAVQAVAERHHLTPGEMDIYHRRNLDSSSQPTLFSMANLVNPGTFPFDAMETFTTPGLALFTQLEGLPSDLMVYDELVQTARAMADTLGGELLLPDRRVFDIDAWEGLRIELLSLINQRAEAV